MDITALYKQVILDHSKHPKNFGTLDSCTHKCEGNNPLCGDSLSLEIEKDGDTIKNIAFTGQGCAISKASSSLMTEAVKGMNEGEAIDLVSNMRSMITTEDSYEVPRKLEVFSNIRQFPSRIKCAMLPWHTLRKCLEGSEEVASTE